MGAQRVHIAPEAFKVSSAEFGEEVDFWQDALPEELRGKLELVSAVVPLTPLEPRELLSFLQLAGAEVLAIDGDAPFAAVNASARQTGRMQALGTRQNM